MSENTCSREIDPFLLNRSEAAKYLGIGISTLAELSIPKTMIKRRVLYRRDVLENFAKQQTEALPDSKVKTKKKE